MLCWSWSENTFLNLTNISVVLYKLLQCVSRQHETTRQLDIMEVLLDVCGTTRHHGKRPAPLIYCLEATVILWYPISDFFFKTVQRNFYRSDFPILWDLIGGAFRTMKHCVHRRYPKISIFSEILLLCQLCKNISHKFTRVAMIQLKYLHSKALDVSMMNRD